MSEILNKENARKPEWLRKRLPVNASVNFVGRGLRERKLFTICEEGRCPNIGECFSKNVATMLIMGRICTRNCGFCGVTHGVPEPLNPDEPAMVAEETQELGLRFVVITSVTRDDLPDGGAAHFANVISALRSACPEVGIELLVPDFSGRTESLDVVLEACPDVLSHNIETAARLYNKIRPRADYGRSIRIIERAARHGGSIVKSGFMVGLGETREDITGIMSDLRKAGCEMITIGQYLSPSVRHFPVQEYIRPEIYTEYEAEAMEMGFSSVASGPFVRSSYLAENFYNQLLQKRSEKFAGQQ